LEKLAGKRGGQVVSGLLSNFDAAENAMNNMEKAAGSADREMGIIEESAEYKINRLKETWVGVSQDVFNKDSLKGAIDGLTGFSTVLGGIIGQLGLFGTATTAGGITAFVKLFPKLKSSVNLLGGKVDVLSSFKNGNNFLFDVNAFKQYETMLSGLSEKQAMMTLQLAGYNEEQAKEIVLKTTSIGVISQETNLTDKQVLGKIGLTTATGTYNQTEIAAARTKAASMLASGQLTEAEHAQALAALENASANATLGSSFKVIGAGLKTLAMNPLTWVAAAIAALVVGVNLYHKFTVSATEAKEAIQATNDAVQTNLKTANDNKKTIDSLTDSYEKLSKGVNSFNNENRSLSSEDYEEYLDIVNQIADVYPELVKGYDQNGNAILSLKGNVDQLAESYQKATKEAYALAWSGSKDIENSGVGTVAEAFKYNTNKLSPSDNWKEFIGNVFGRNLKNERTNDDYLKTYNELLGINNISDLVAWQEKHSNSDALSLAGISFEELSFPVLHLSKT